MASQNDREMKIVILLLAAALLILGAVAVAAASDRTDRMPVAVFDLRRYTDPATGFISSKSSGGRELRAQELPGLWNGTMSRWNTIFVDVPITTFSPVKVVQDLLRPQHQ